ncbi:MAG: LysM peptidoglycan-binding domain-containing protein [Armatimonadetes bacterium]|nr:LysM peptidoglycan-binding domain-containing protein [Armatimonadota bacterium]
MQATMSGRQITGTATRSRRRARRRVFRCGLLALVLVAAAAASASRGKPEPPQALAYIVQPGDSLWRVAGQLPIQGDRRAGTWLLQKINGLSGPDLLPGQRLLLPADPASMRAAQRDPRGWRDHAVVAPSAPERPELPPKPRLRAA